MTVAARESGTRGDDYVFFAADAVRFSFQKFVGGGNGAGGALCFKFVSALLRS